MTFLIRHLYSVVIVFLYVLTVAGCFSAHAQTGWDSYVARYESGLGSVQLNMELNRAAPQSDLPYLLITGVTCHDCSGDGFPSHKEYKKLYRISKEINRLIFEFTQRSSRGDTVRSLLGSSQLVGTFTHSCRRLDYLYVADTTGIRESLSRLYRKRFKNYAFHIELRRDPEWDTYRKFLYPNEGVRIFMMNSRAITRMTDAGDALSRPRFVEHLIYFDTIEDRDYFIRYIGRINYDIKDVREISRDSLRYQVLLARFGTVSLEEMNDQTTYLHAKAGEFNGVYSGWQTKLIGTKQRFHLLYNPIAEPTITSK